MIAMNPAMFPGIPPTIPVPSLGMCALCLRQQFLDVEAERLLNQRWNTPEPAITTFRGTATCYMHLEDLYAGSPITYNRKPFPDQVTIGTTGGYPLRELIHWLEIARDRWGFNEQQVTFCLEGTRLMIYQNGVYRAAIPLHDQPQLTSWADEHA